MKKLWLIISLLFAIGFASAAELSELLAEVDSSLVVLIALFLISFSLSFFALHKIFKEDKTIPGVISVVLAFLVVYGVNKIGFDTQDFFYNMGISESTFSLILFMVITGGIIFMIVSLKKKKTAFLILGALMIGLSFFVYAKVLLITLGIILLLIWFFISISGKNPRSRHLSKEEAKRYTD